MFLLSLLTLPFGYGAKVQWLDSYFSITSQNIGVEGGWQISLDCPDNKWCGMIVCDGTADIGDQVFIGGDAYILARHSLCDCDCCEGLQDNAVPNHTCPNPACCNSVGMPIGLRSFPDVSYLREYASCIPATTSILPDYPLSFEYAVVEEGRNYANLSLPFGSVSPDYLKLDNSERAIVLAQASVGAHSFDGGATTLDVGYHGRYAFTSCLMNGNELCGCGWPLDIAEARQDCVPLNSNSTKIARNAGSTYTKDINTLLLTMSFAILLL